MTDMVHLHIDKSIARITMNRPKALNALDLELADGLRKAAIRVEHDDAVRCVILDSSSEHFMAGGDLVLFKSWLDAGRDETLMRFEETFAGAHGLITSIKRMRKPVIASVSGAVAGFGFSLMAVCDLVIAARTTTLSLAYVRIGASPDGGSTHALPRLVGVKRAMEIAMLGDNIDAQKAADIGLINLVVEAGDLAAETDRLARRLADGPTEAIAGAKLLINQSMETPLGAQLQAEEQSFAHCAQTRDFAEGVTAFVEKRKPDFTGR